MISVKDNIQKIEERIEKACLRCGRKREEIVLMGVTKFQPLEAVEEAWDAGIRCFGESRVQEAVEKYNGFSERHSCAELHLIGSLQRNKAKIAVSLFDCIQSLDREVLITELARHASGRNHPLQVLLELRTGEDTKSGFTDLDELYKAAEFALGFPSLRVRGLMTMAPLTGEEKPVRAAFRKLVQARQELESRFPAKSAQYNWDCLSMGMSGDYEIAVEEGSTMIRIGGAIFAGK